MGSKKVNSPKMVEISESALLTLVANTLKDKDLFPKKTEAAKKYLKGVQLTNIK